MGGRNLAPLTTGRDWGGSLAFPAFTAEAVNCQRGESYQNGRGVQEKKMKKVKNFSTGQKWAKK